jgi:hypothetical protein|eukprot:COSAG01_NODE_3653_length_5823_cov_10.850280_8_plen_65_part_00
MSKVVPIRLAIILPFALAWLLLRVVLAPPGGGIAKDLQLLKNLLPEFLSQSGEAKQQQATQEQQ